MSYYLPFVKRFVLWGSYMGMGKLALEEDDYELRIGQSFLIAHAAIFALGHWFALPTLISEAYDNLNKRMETGDLPYEDICWAFEIADAVSRHCRGLRGPATEQMNEVSDRLREVKRWKDAREIEKSRQRYGYGGGLRRTGLEGQRAGFCPRLWSHLPMEVCRRRIKRARG